MKGLTDKASTKRTRPLNEKNYRITYTAGPRLHFRREITRSDHISICETLSRRFSAAFGGVYVFEPEAVSEGGFDMRQFPGREEEMFKTFRHHLAEWPSVTPNVMEEWRLDRQLLIPSETKIDTTLKAFYGAPVWKQSELTIIYDVLADYGVRVTHKPRIASRLSSPASECT